MSSQILLIVVGLAVLTAGGDLLVRGASKLAALIKISPMVIGLTVVAFGTSAPELSVSLWSAFHENTEVAVGNVVGSNIFNILFILGLSAVIAPLTVLQRVVRWEVPIMIGASFLFWFFALDRKIVTWEGGVLFLGILIYSTWAIVQSRKETSLVAAEYEGAFGGTGEASARHKVLQVVFIVLGLVLLVVGSRWLVEGASALALRLGVSNLVVGLTIVSVGTSLPELATSVIAAARGERDIAIGNVVGSNIFNILSIMGLTALLSPVQIAVPELCFDWDIPIMTGVALVCLPVFFTGKRISRMEGAFFLTAYVAYTYWLIVRTSGM